MSGWESARLPNADGVVATAWQSADAVAQAPAEAGAKFYFIQHYESLYHGDPRPVDATYALPLRKIVISTWLADIMKERFNSAADVLVTPVDRALFHPVPEARSDDALRVLMLHHDYAWKGVREGLSTAVEALCELLSIELTPARRSILVDLDEAGLRALKEQIIQTRRWD